MESLIFMEVPDSYRFVTATVIDLVYGPFVRDNESRKKELKRKEFLFLFKLEKFILLFANSAQKKKSFASLN